MVAERSGIRDTAWNSLGRVSLSVTLALAGVSCADTGAEPAADVGADVGAGLGPDTGTTENDTVERLPYYADRSFTPMWLEHGSPQIETLHRIPEFHLRNQDGAPVSRSTLDGKIVVANFFFTTCPGICPRMTRNMKSLQTRFAADDDVVLVSHTVTPDVDTVDRLQQYAKDKGIASGKWHLLTGDRETIYALGRKAYFVDEDLGEARSEDDFLHTENFVLIDGDGHIRGVYNGLNQTSMTQLGHDIELLERTG